MRKNKNEWNLIGFNMDYRPLTKIPMTNKLAINKIG